MFNTLLKKAFCILSIFATIILPSLWGGLGWDLHAQSGTWVYWGGTHNDNGRYGTQGIFSSLNTPAGRDGAANWTDKDGNFWLFGGESDSLGESEYFNDLWEYNPIKHQWAWIDDPQYHTNATGMAPAAQSLMDYLGIKYYPLIPQKYGSSGKRDSKDKNTDILSATSGTPLIAYPNPSTDATTFSYVLPVKNTQVLIKITGIDGHVVNIIPLSTNSIMYNWQHTDIAPGLYICQLFVDEHLYRTTRITIVK